jgi:aspartyl-tRNA(Asn)/glutamyl-tRNA(Gln) amidotransferase subunit A
VKNRQTYPSTIHELSTLLANREISSSELTKYYLDRIDEVDGKIGAFITKCRDSALKAAKEADGRIARGDMTPLTGIPMAIKDIFITKGIRTTCASKILENYIPPYDGTAVARLKGAGVVLTGKLNMDEFAMGASNEYSAFGPVKNPWNAAFTPGGSSGGSAAAVAAGFSPASLGTDTGGSIRLPASFCNVVGMKPTYGRVSRFGVVAFASSLDQVGPFARDVTDLAVMLGTIAGFDPNDSTSIDADVPDYPSLLNGGVKGLKLGMPKEYFVSGIEPNVEAAVKAAARQFEKLGAKIVEVSLPHTKYAVPCYYIIAPAEASSNLARYDGMRYGHRAKGTYDLTELFNRSRTEGFGPEVSLRIIVGTYVLSSGYYDAYYLKAQRARTLIKEDFLKAFKTCDAILAPVAATPPFKLGERTDDPVKMYLTDVYTAPVNLAGLPGMSVPCGFSKENLPIGLQIIGRPLDEATMLKIAYSYEQSTDWHKKAPKI